jgi:hypothetical protein
MPVATVGAGDIILIGQICANAGGNRFFADVEMDETGNFAGCKKLGDTVFKGSNLGHGDIHINQLFIGQIHCFPPSFFKVNKKVSQNTYNFCALGDPSFLLLKKAKPPLKGN